MGPIRLCNVVVVNNRMAKRIGFRLDLKQPNNAELQFCLGCNKVIKSLFEIRNKLMYFYRRLFYKFVLKYVLHLALLFQLYWNSVLRCTYLFLTRKLFKNA